MARGRAESGLAHVGTGSLSRPLGLGKRERAVAFHCDRVAVLAVELGSGNVRSAPVPTRLLNETTARSLHPEPMPALSVGTSETEMKNRDRDLRRSPVEAENRLSTQPSHLGRDA